MQQIGIFSHSVRQYIIWTWVVTTSKQIFVLYGDETAIFGKSPNNE